MTQSDGHTLDADIQTNLQGMVTLGARLAPGVRILNVGYPYVVNSTNSCSSDSGTWHGSKSVIDDLNTDHTAVTGANVKYVNLATQLGTSPITSGYIQETRLYGYPHPSATGQSQIATAATTALTGSW